MKILYVHIGTQKTGTTAIQQFCMQNRKVLAKNGFCYPGFPYRYPGKSKNRNGLFLTSVYGSKSDPGHEMIEQQIFAEGMAKIKRLFQKYDNVILSDEVIWAAVKKRRKSLWLELKEAAEAGGFTVKIIVYLRRQDEYAASLWNQQIKHALRTVTWEEFCENSESMVNLEYYETLKYAADILGVENIIVRRYERENLVGGMSQLDFLDALGLTLTDEYRIEQPYINDKLSLNGCEIKRIVNSVPGLTLKESRFFEYTLRDALENTKGEHSCILWSREESERFVSRYQSDNEKIAKIFFRDGKALFSESYSDGEVWQKNNPFMSDDIIRFFTATNLSLVREIDEMKQQMNTMKEQMNEMQEHIEMLRKFRQKVKRPFRTAWKILTRRWKCD